MKSKALKQITVLLMLLAVVVSQVSIAEDKVLDKAERGIKKGADATVKGVKKGAEATGNGVKKGGDWVSKKLDKVFK